MLLYIAWRILLSDLKKTQHYSTKAEQILFGLDVFIPENAKLIEPFVGRGDLVKIFPTHNWEVYDIDPKIDCIKQDTLIEPPNYIEKWVITNPPFLAKNKAVEKTLFNTYDDLYKVFLSTIFGVEGGIIIVPSNFFLDEGSEKIRREFIDRFSIKQINFFTQPMFDETTYSVCSFAFSKQLKKEKEQTIPCFIQNEGPFSFTISKDFGYRIGGDFFSELGKEKNIFSRLTETSKQKYVYNIKLFALDTRNEKIRLEYCEEPFIGKVSDRSYATLCGNIELSDELQRQIIFETNKQLNNFRDKYYNLPLTNYRDFNRKRVGFEFIYNLSTKVYYELINN